MIIKCFGISFSLSASVEVIILSLSNSIKGKLPGFDPVAIIIFLDSIDVFLSPFISILLASIKLANPWNTSILFFPIKKSIPLVVCSTTWALRSIIFLKSILTSPFISIPCSEKCLVASSK